MTVPREIRNANVPFVGEIYGTRLQISLTVTSYTCAQTYARTDPPTRALVNRWPRDCAPALSHPTRPKCPNMGSWNLGASGHRTIRGRPPLFTTPRDNIREIEWVFFSLSTPSSSSHTHTLTHRAFYPPPLSPPPQRDESVRETGEFLRNLLLCLFLWRNNVRRQHYNAAAANAWPWKWDKRSGLKRGHSWPLHGRMCPSCGPIGPSAGRISPSSGHIGPSGGRFSPSSGHIWPSAGQIWPSAENIRWRPEDTRHSGLWRFRTFSGLTR